MDPSEKGVAYRCVANMFRLVLQSLIFDSDKDIGKRAFHAQEHAPITLLNRLRSYLGYPPVRDAQPNPIHYSLAALQHATITPQIITHNVDGLHHKAIKHLWDKTKREQGILELHGTLHVRAALSLAQALQ